MPKIAKEAKATFSYTVNGNKETITVGGKLHNGKTDDDWKTSLIIDAGQKASKLHGLKREAILGNM